MPVLVRLLALAAEKRVVIEGAVPVCRCGCCLNHHRGGIWFIGGECGFGAWLAWYACVQCGMVCGWTEKGGFMWSVLSHVEGSDDDKTSSFLLVGLQESDISTDSRSNMREGRSFEVCVK